MDLAKLGVVSVWCGPDGGRQGSLCADVAELPGSDGVEAQAGDGLLAGVSRPYGGQSQEARVAGLMLAAAEINRDRRRHGAEISEHS